MTRVTAAVIERAGRFLIARRKPGLRFAGVWEFPGGKVEPDETPEAGLRREIAEELEIEIAVGAPLGSFPHSGPDLSIELLAYRAEWVGGDIVLHDHAELRWVTPAEMPSYDFALPDRGLVRLLRGEAAP
jgi:mutator protein MutT